MAVRKRINLAIVAPSNSALSETFINAHKKIPEMNVYFHYGTPFPTELDGWGTLISSDWIHKLYGSAMAKFTGWSRWEYELKRSLIKHKIDCVLAEYGTTGAKILKVCKSLKVPLVIHFHGTDASTHKIIKKYRSRYLEMFGYANKIIAVSKEMINDLEKLGCPPNKIEYNTYGPNDSFLDIKQGSKNGSFLSVGRFVDKKAPHLTILAFQKVVEKHNDAKLIMVGDGMLLQTCQDLVSQLGLKDNITFAGEKNPEEIRELLSQSVAFIQHSVEPASGNKEGTPVAILEAQAAGLPVISTYHAGIPDVVLDSETGFLVEERDCDAMANRMCDLIEDPDLAMQMGQKARKRIKDQFRLDRHLDHLSLLIQQSQNGSFLSIGRFVDKKAPHLTILAFQKVVEKHNDAKLIMVGDGMLLQTCQDLVSQLGLKDNITFAGEKNPEEIRELLSQSVAFIQHSVEPASGNKEGTPVAILEAQAAGLPVISTYHAGIPDVVLDSETGFLVEERDCDAMANRMCDLIEDPDLAMQMGQKARKRIKDQFRLDRHLDHLSLLIQQSQM